MKITDIIKSLKGRDVGSYYVIVDSKGSYFKVADGKTRKLGNPKLKNIKHVKFIDNSDIKLTNNDICKILKNYKNGD